MRYGDRHDLPLSNIAQNDRIIGALQDGKFSYVTTTMNKVHQAPSEHVAIYLHRSTLPCSGTARRMGI